VCCVCVLEGGKAWFWGRTQWQLLANPHRHAVLGHTRLKRTCSCAAETGDRLSLCRCSTCCRRSRTSRRASSRSCVRVGRGGGGCRFGLRRHAFRRCRLFKSSEQCALAAHLSAQTTCTQAPPQLPQAQLYPPCHASHHHRHETASRWVSECC